MIIAYYVQKNEQLCKLYAHILLKHMQIELMLLLLHGKLPKSVNKVKILNQHDKKAGNLGFVVKCAAGCYNVPR